MKQAAQINRTVQNFFFDWSRNYKQNINYLTKCFNKILWNFSGLVYYLHSVCIFDFDQVKLLFRFQSLDLFCAIVCRCVFGKCAPSVLFCIFVSMACATASTKCTRQLQKHARQATKKRSIEFGICMYIICTGDLGKKTVCIL